MAELTALVATTALVGAAGAVWYLWRAISWHPQCGIAPIRVAPRPAWPAGRGRSGPRSATDRYERRATGSWWTEWSDSPWADRWTESWPVTGRPATPNGGPRHGTETPHRATDHRATDHRATDHRSTVRKAAATRAGSPVPVADDRPAWPPAADRPAWPPVDRPDQPGGDRIGPNRSDRRYDAPAEAPDREAGPGLLRTAAARMAAGFQACWRSDSRPGGSSGTDGKPSAVTRDELRLAVRAVLVHTPQHWPGGVYCSNDRSPFPCRMRHWGEHVLVAAGWDADSIAAMARQADAGVPPWLAGASETVPPS
jgi:hypothetical protein